MKLDLGKIKSTIGKVVTTLIPKRKQKLKLTQEEIDFIQYNFEAIQYFVKYQPVFKAFVERVAKREREALDKEKPCRFRKDCDKPFMVKCAVCGDDKMHNVCDDCDIRTE